ncbi:hypothetical protein J1605_020817 [Eschrichtius robustus]|uniref:Bromodomain-containing protein 9 n=1 Tax=Eschrichtius robustus TaxID=9764 RepID=A0AB34HE64_ESCRO|nr:hypothetical protein J1605_020817 [Eschrichtius robustus]
MGKKHKKHKAEWRSSYEDYADKPLEKPLKLVLKVGGSEVTELSGSGHDSSYYDDRSDHERERHKEKKKKKKKKSEKEKHLDDEERRKRKEEKKRKREKEHCDTEGEADDFDPGKKVEVEPPPDRPVRACRTQPAENESTPIQQLLEHFLRQLQRKDPHGFFAFPVTDAIAPGYSMIIKHPMDFGTMKDKIVANEYKSVTEFKADFKLMCDNAMTYNRPDTVYYKLAKKILHAGFKMMSKERLLALKRSMSFMQDMDFSQQAALLGNEDTAVEEPVPEVVPVQVETAKKSKRPSREVIRTRIGDLGLPVAGSARVCCFGQTAAGSVASRGRELQRALRRPASQPCAAPGVACMFEPEGNACSLTDSTAEEHVLALVEHAADEARDRISRLLPGGKVAPPTGWLCLCRDSGTAVTGERSAGHYERAALLSSEGCEPVQRAAGPHEGALRSSEHLPTHKASYIRASDRNRMGYLKKNGDGSLLYSVVNTAEPDADEEETHPVDLSALSSKLLPGFTALGFREERRSRGVARLPAAGALREGREDAWGSRWALRFARLRRDLPFPGGRGVGGARRLRGAWPATALSTHNNSVFGDLKCDEVELLYSAYGDETGVQCALRRPSSSGHSVGRGLGVMTVQAGATGARVWGGRAPSGRAGVTAVLKRVSWLREGSSRQTKRLAPHALRASSPGGGNPRCRCGQGSPPEASLTGVQTAFPRTLARLRSARLCPELPSSGDTKLWGRRSPWFRQQVRPARARPRRLLLEGLRIPGLLNSPGRRPRPSRCQRPFPWALPGPRESCCSALLPTPRLLVETLQARSPPRPTLQEFVKDAGSYSKKLVDDLLDQITGGDHSRLLFQLRQVGALGHSCARRTGR